MTNKERYKILCETEGSKIPLFLQYWWMEVVCEGKQWDVILSENKQGEIKGAMPYLIGSKLGLRYVLQPQLTQFNGPWYYYPSNLSENKRLQFEKEVAGDMIAKLKELKLAFFRQNWNPQITNWLPFYWAGFKQTTRYTYKLEDINDLEKVWMGFDRHSRQSKIEKAQTLLHVDESLSIDEFVDFHVRYWKSKGEKDITPKSLMSRLIKISIERKQGLLLGLRDVNNELQAARFVVFDNNCAYSLLSALNPGGHINGASPLLFWEIIKRLSKLTKTFDFEGSMDEGIEQSYRLYGAKQTPYMQIEKAFWYGRRKV